MPSRRIVTVKITVLSPKPITDRDMGQVLLDMEADFNAKATRFRVHVAHVREKLT